MKVCIDISVFRQDEEAIGRVHGSVAIAAVPIVGSFVSFTSPAASIAWPSGTGFKGFLAIRSVKFVANSEDVLLEMEDMVVQSREDGMAIVAYLEKGFGLYFDEY